MSKILHNIGIGLTTHNRYDTFKHTYEQIRKYSDGCKIVVVDDCSDVPVSEADYRFKKNVGIAAAKNKCFELLDDCEHIFLFDDDCFPKCDNWYLPYIENPEPHLMYIFKDFATNVKLNDTILLYQDSKTRAWSHARGCMCYYHHSCLETVGGMDTRFGRWGWEHPALSDRIFNSGLTTFRYADVQGSENLIHSADEFQTVKSTVHGQERIIQINRNRAIYEQCRNSTDYIPYSGNNVIITTYFNNVIDHQRNRHFAPDMDILKPLIDSTVNERLILLHDCFDNIDFPEHVTPVRVQTSETPYFQRWISIYQYLREKEFDKVFCVDATDVEMLRSPFPEMKFGTLYTGDKETTLLGEWMIKQHPNEELQRFIQVNAKTKLLNAGLLGGERWHVMEFLHAIIKMYFDNKADIFYHKRKPVGQSDMGVFNYVARTLFADKISNGRHVNTRFKHNEKNNESWFKHK